MYQISTFRWRKSNYEKYIRYKWKITFWIFFQIPWFVIRKIRSTSIVFKLFFKKRGEKMKRIPAMIWQQITISTSLSKYLSSSTWNTFNNNKTKSVETKGILNLVWRDMARMKVGHNSQAIHISQVLDNVPAESQLSFRTVRMRVGIRERFH